jgi:hypothetical protein
MFSGSAQHHEKNARFGHAPEASDVKNDEHRSYHFPPSSMQTMLFSAFTSRDDAHRAVEELENHGFSANELSVISKEYRDAPTHTTAGSTASGLVGGVTTGGVIGGIAGLLAGAGVFPALAGLLIGGPIAAALGVTGIAAAAVSGAVTGAAVGGLVGALMGLGFSQSEAEYYQETIDQGGLLLAVSVNEENMAEALHVLKANHARQIKEMGIDSNIVDRMPGRVSPARDSMALAADDVESETTMYTETEESATARKR